jgi:hypothetical protein
VIAHQQIRRIAEIEFAHLVSAVEPLGSKLRVFIRDGSFVDIWVAEQLPDRFGFHWERGHLDGTLFRYDNFPDTLWRNLETFPFHFGSSGMSVGGRISLPAEAGIPQAGGEYVVMPAEAGIQ